MIDNHIQNMRKEPERADFECFGGLREHERSIMKSSNIGGQAVMEGIMMRYKDEYAIAVRKECGEIDISVHSCASTRFMNKVKKIPFIRGIFSFIDSMVLGIKTLTYSAGILIEEEEQKEKAEGNEAEAKKIEKERKKNEDSGHGLLLAGTIMVSLIFSLALFVAAPWFLTELMRKHTELHETVILLLEGIVRLAIFFVYLTLISRMKDIQRVFMYHGSEHKCINCIEHGKILNVENVRESSRLHKRCGTSFLLIVMVVSLVVFLLIKISNPITRLVFRILMMPVIAGISYEFIRIAGRSDNKFVVALSKPGMLLQKVTTREPDDSMIEVAIASVEAVFDWKEYLKENDIDVEAQEDSHK